MGKPPSALSRTPDRRDGTPRDATPFCRGWLRRPSRTLTPKNATFLDLAERLLPRDTKSFRWRSLFASNRHARPKSSRIRVDCCAPPASTPFLPSLRVLPRPLAWHSHRATERADAPRRCFLPQPPAPAGFFLNRLPWTVFSRLAKRGRPRLSPATLLHFRHGARTARHGAKPLFPRVGRRSRSPAPRKPGSRLSDR